MSTISPPLKRVKRKLKGCPNPLFEKWLKEWKDEASQNGSDMQHCFNKALKSLRKFPFKLSSGKECILLENFGSKICSMLDKRIEEYNSLQNQDTDMNLKYKTEEIGKGNHADKKASTEMSLHSQKSTEGVSDLGTNVSKPADYYPEYRSGGYAILRAMFEKSQANNFKDCFSKTEIQNSAQAYCDSSLTIPNPGSYYTAWSSMTTLIKKDLVVKIGNPPKYCLTEKGTDVAIKLSLLRNENQKIQIETNNSKIVVSEEKKSTKSPNKSPKQKCTETNVKENRNEALSKQTVNIENTLKSTVTPYNGDVEETIFMLPNSFEIILLVDNQERDNKFQQADQMTMRQLKSRQVNFEIRHLKVGDFIWIARNNKGEELVLPYVVERKRMDDLASSIKDGRFHEQKFRLKQSGLENLIYLVEKYGTENQRLGLPLPTLMQAISNTQVLGCFTVRITNNHNHSMSYLDCMTTQLSNIFKSKTLMGCKKSNVTQLKLSDDLIPLMNFQDFNKGSEKNKKLTVRNMLVKHLLQLNGLSVEKATAIVQQYPTPKVLMKALKEPDAEKLIGKLTYGGFNRCIGPALAKQIQMLYTSEVLK